MTRVAVLTASLLMFAPSLAVGLELSWASGERDLHVTLASACTLFVKATPGDSLFQHTWRFVWAGTATVDTPLVVVAAAGTSAEPGPYSVALGPSKADSLGRVTIALFRPEVQAAGLASAMYIMRVHPSLQANLALAPLATANTAAWSLDSLNCLTINGGSDVPFPPVLCDAARMNGSASGEALPTSSAAARVSTQAVLVVGLGLSAVSRAALVRTSHGDVPEPLDILGVQDTALTVALPADLREEQAVLVLSRADGVASTLSVPSPQLAASPLAYQYATVADSAFVGIGAVANFAVNPADLSYGLRYLHVRPEGGADVQRYFSLQDGVWLREDLPSWMVPIGSRNMAIGKDGDVHAVEHTTSQSSLLHYWRSAGSGAQWHADSINTQHTVEDQVVAVDTTASTVEVVYRTIEYGRPLLRWAQHDV